MASAQFLEQKKTIIGLQNALMLFKGSKFGPLNGHNIFNTRFFMKGRQKDFFGRTFFFSKFETFAVVFYMIIVSVESYGKKSRKRRKFVSNSIHTGKKLLLTDFDQLIKSLK